MKMKLNRFQQQKTRLARFERGITLIEVLVSLAIAAVLMGALAMLFSQSVMSRQQVDREGQKLENGRYSIETLSEDIRLAGYYGQLPIAGVGSLSADWKYVAPCSTTVADGWSPTTFPAQLPFALYGYEAHPDPATGSPPTLPATLTGCLDNYKAGTDVLVVRRASTVAVPVGGTGYVAGEPYIQVSSCSDGSIDAKPFVVSATASDFNLHSVACTTATPGPNTLARKLVYRIYYISTCNECGVSPDSTPTLKVAELGLNGGTLKIKENIKTVAPGVENMHIEFGIDNLNDDGAADNYILSNSDPAASALGTPMRQDAASEDQWEDVVSVKLFLVTRDLEATRNYTDTRSFVMGARSLNAANDGFHRRLVSSTINVANASMRRAQ
jgi:type IV pilus assembly protein PilW